MTDRETWLSTIRSNPSDWQAMLVFADWLEESGDLLAAEQWRFLAVVYGSNSLWRFHVWWPRLSGLVITNAERDFAAENNIRCMPTYPLTIGDVQAYLETAQ